MNDRERLIEILDTAEIKQELRSSTGRTLSLYHAKIVNSEYVKPLTELLIANGVTIQKHGRWIIVNGIIRCSECNAHVNYEMEQGQCFFPDESKYCHNCGAKMELEEENAKT